MGIPATPRAWLDADLPSLTAEVEEEMPTRPVRRADLLAEDAAALKAAAGRMRADGTTAQAAATYVAGWFPGGAGRIVGVGLGAAGAGLLLAPDEVTWHVADEGWPAKGTVGEVGLLVPPGHPWSGLPGVETVSEREMLVRTVGALISFAAPLVEACKGLGKVSRSSLWDEVADGIACAFSYKPRPIDPAVMELLSRAVDLPGTPWKARPRLSNVNSALLGPVHVAQKGGCCLAFTCKHQEFPELTDRERAWKERFPADGTKRYCSTCKFREPEDSYARQVFWLELEHSAPDQLAPMPPAG